VPCKHSSQRRRVSVPDNLAVSPTRGIASARCAAYGDDFIEIGPRREHLEMVIRSVKAITEAMALDVQFGGQGER
jgi:hypothetical protein